MNSEDSDSYNVISDGSLKEFVHIGGYLVCVLVFFVCLFCLVLVARTQYPSTQRVILAEVTVLTL